MLAFGRVEENIAAKRECAGRALRGELGYVMKTLLRSVAAMAVIYATLKGLAGR